MKKLAQSTYIFLLFIVSLNLNAAFDENLLKSPFSSWGISPEFNSSINLKQAWKHYKKNKDIVVAVIDTGIDPTHSFFKNNIVYKNNESFGKDFSKGTHSPLRPTDDHGHGTHVSGIIKSILPNVKILTLKYYNPVASGEDNLNSTIEALKFAVESNVDIINYSGGGPEASPEELAILKKAEAKGILVVAASGNNSANIDIVAKAYYPASYKLKNIITVTAHDQALNLLDSSNYGDHTVDIAAPGFRIKSTLPNNRVGFLTGTSQATAFVSGVAALIKSQYPKLSAEELKRIINLSAKQELSLFKKCKSNGRIDASKALELASASDDSKRNLASVKKQKAKKEGKIIYRVSNNAKNEK